MSTQKEIIKILKLGGIGVIPTDTLYGIVGSALIPETVERIYHVRRRDLKKPLIVLISSLNDLKKFGINLTLLQEKKLKEFWPGKVSVVLECKGKKFSPPQPKGADKEQLLKNKNKALCYKGMINDYARCGGKHLHRRKNSIAFRFPYDFELLNLLKKVGPLVAPSANRAGDEPATNFKEARAYFTDEVDFYVDAGKLKSKPSTLVEMNKKGEIKVLREGAVKIVI